MSMVALKKLLTDRASQIGKPSNWPVSIVDLMKLLGQDSREHHLIEVANKLNYTGDTRYSYQMHIWLHKQLIKILAQNDGNLPVELQK